MFFTKYRNGGGKPKVPKNTPRDTNQVSPTILLVFHWKDLCDARPKMQSVFKFSDILFALKSDGPLVEASSGQEWY